MAQFSLRFLLFAVAFVAVACAALKYADPVWWNILATGTLLLFMASAVVAFVGKHAQRARAIGFAVCIAIYAAVVLVSPANELLVGEGRLPTTTVMKALIPLTVPLTAPSARSTDLDDIRLRLGDTDIYGFESNNVGNGVLTLDRANALVGTSVYLMDEHPELLRIAHLLWALLFGFLGSLFAGFVYRRNDAGS